MFDLTRDHRALYSVVNPGSDSLVSHWGARPKSAASENPVFANGMGTQWAGGAADTVGRGRKRK